MEIELCIKKRKEIYSGILDFFEATNDIEKEFAILINVLIKNEILQNKNDILDIFQLLSKIESNIHRTPDFYDKFRRIINYFFQNPNVTISDSEIFNIYKTNKMILLFLFEQQYLNVDNFIHYYFMNNEYRLFLYPSIKNHIKDEKIKKMIEDEILNLGEEIEVFEQKCKIGENDSYICSLIRQDSIEEFVTYINRQNISLTSTINPSLFETNSFLNGKNPSLIEYASFYGSIQIFHFLRYNQVPLKKSIWLYAIHSNNAEFIHILEENIKLDSYDNVLKESIKCHHNNISNYIRDNLLDSNDNELSYIYDNCILYSCNYYYYPDNVQHFISKNRNKNAFNISNLHFNLPKITIPSTVTEIGDFAFSDCISLEEIIIPSSIVKIGKGCFSNCFSLTTISIPSSVTEINEKSFSDCSSLKQISIPSSVTKIGKKAFSGCCSLNKIEILSSSVLIGEKVFHKIISLELTGSLTQINDYMFNDCSTLAEIKIPSTITRIGSNAFSKCSSLTQIEIPSSVTEIGESAFFWCSVLKRIKIPDSLTSIEKNTFYGCSSLIEIIIPPSITVIGDNSFSLCSSLTQIRIPSSVIKIGDNAFNGCSSLKKIEIPSSVILIGEYAFGLCTSLEQIEIPYSVTEIGNFAFSMCFSLSKISIPSSISIESLGIDDTVEVIKT